MSEAPTSLPPKDALTPATQNVYAYSKLFSVLAKPDCMKLFLSAKDGLKIDLLTPTRLQLSRKQYYKALKLLKEVGLIQRVTGAYFHTSFGRIIYQKNILDLAECAKYFEGMQVLGKIRSVGQGSSSHTHVEDKFISFIEKLTDKRDSDGKGKEAVNASTSPITVERKIELVWTYEEMISLLLECIDICKDEILIATRVSPEIIIKTIQQKSKEGTKVRVLADEGLIREYFRLHKTNNIDLDDQDKNGEDRIRVISNPWYPGEKNIERRICQVPFGMIIIDGKLIGIELIDQSNPYKFKAGILLKDEKICVAMRDYYQRMWDSGYSDLAKVREKLIDKT